MKLSYTVIETCVISFRESDDKFASSLIARVNAYTSIDKSLRVHECDQLKEEVRLRFKQIRCLAFDGSLKFFCVVAGYPIPCLSFSPVHYKGQRFQCLMYCRVEELTIIDAIRIMILLNGLR